MPSVTTVPNLMVRRAMSDDVQQEIGGRTTWRGPLVRGGLPVPGFETGDIRGCGPGVDLGKVIPIFPSMLGADGSGWPELIQELALACAFVGLELGVAAYNQVGQPALEGFYRRWRVDSLYFLPILRSPNSISPVVWGVSRTTGPRRWNSGCRSLCVPWFGYHPIATLPIEALTQ